MHEEDWGDWTLGTESEFNSPPVAYVPEDWLTSPELQPGGKCWLEAYGPQPLLHPYAGYLFLGQDARGDLLPCRALRNQFGAQRRDVYPPGQDGGGDGGGGDDLDRV